MSLPHAILGFLNYAPMTGYDLKKAFDTSVRHFWPADQAQIYRTLKELMRQGWVTVEVVPQEDRPNRKVYHITEAGREELRRWLRTPTAPEDPRVPLLVKVFFAGGLADEEAAALLEAYAAGLRDRLEAYARIPRQAAHYAEAIRSPREVFFWALTLDYGVRLTRAALEWAEEAIRNIRNLKEE
ncbi:MAG: PadR family transcriptional regulator [Thermoflexia bacterium]|nr:MAG: PadR family transcriptional regulator [Thermoflexia bacterium]